MDYFRIFGLSRMLTYISSEDILVIDDHKDGPLPTVDNWSKVTVIHAIHGDRSYAMVWNEESGTLSCPHCGEKINLSRVERTTILTAMSEKRKMKRYKSGADVLICQPINKVPTQPLVSGTPVQVLRIHQEE